MWFTSCFDDLGNYDYRDVNDVMGVTIDSLEAGYIFNIGDQDTLIPYISGMDDESNYRFTWYIYTRDDLTDVDTLGTEKILILERVLAPANYKLVFEVRDKRTDLFVHKKMVLSVDSPYAKGWFIVHDDGALTDVDFIYEKDSVYYQTTLNLGLRGKGRKLQKTYRFTQEIQADDGKITTKRIPAFFVLSEQELNVYNGTDFSLVKSFDEMFYQLPERLKPENVWSSTDYYVMNDGQMYSQATASSNRGKFGLPKTNDEQTEMHLAPEMIFSYSSCMGFDQLSRTFYQMSAYGIVNRLKEVPGKVSPSSMDADLLCFLQRNNATGYALMKNVDSRKDEYYLMDITVNGTNYPFQMIDTLKDKGGNMIQATCKAAHLRNSCIYFSKGSELWMYVVADMAEREKFICNYPGETITFISTETSGELAVVTSTGNRWKIYRYKFVSNSSEVNLDEPIEPVFEGEGTARYMCFRSN